MSKQRVAAVLSAVTLLGLAGSAGAQPNSVTNPNDTGGEVAGSGGGAAAGEAGGSLPFTGFQAAIVFLGGAGIAATGFALRRVGRNNQS